jgi:hypothetical protein
LEACAHGLPSGSAKKEGQVALATKARQNWPSIRNTSSEGKFLDWNPMARQA